MPRIINLNEIVLDPVIIKFGTLDIDVTQIPAYYSFCMLDYAERQKSGKTTPTEAMDLIIAAVQSVHPDLSEQDILKCGNAAQFVGLILALSKELVRTYDPDAGEDTPFAKIQEVAMK